MMTENINSIVDRLLTDTHILSIMPFLVILLAKSIFRYTICGCQK